MADRYIVILRHEVKTNDPVEYVVVEDAVYPDDPSKFKPNNHEWHRRQLLEDMYLVRFNVSPYQPAHEAKRRAREYADFLNKQDEQMQIAAKLVQL